MTAERPGFDPGAQAANQAPSLEKDRELFPTPEDWVVLQGGRPRVFRNPRHPNGPWIVLHVYDEHPDHEHRFQSGAIVDTVFREGNIPISRLGVPVYDEDGRQRGTKDIKVPAFMNRHVHGDLCEGRSGAKGGKNGYPRVKNQIEYEKLVDTYRSQGYQEIRYGIGPQGLRLEAMPKIRDPRPLLTPGELATQATEETPEVPEDNGGESAA